MLPIGAIHACLGRVGQDNAGAARVPAGFVGIAPDRHGIAAQKGEVAPLDRGIAVVARDHHGVAVQPFEGAW